MIRTLVYTGKDFYWKSGTIMSSIYEVVNGTYHRFDWGFLELALGKGDEFVIRQATAAETKMFLKQLEEVKGATK